MSSVLLAVVNHIKMKNFILAFAMFGCLSVSAQNQSGLAVKLDKQGNFVSVKKDSATPVATGRYYVDGKGHLCPVFKTPTGRIFALRVSKKTGKTYRTYLKTDRMTIDNEGN